MAAKKYLVLSFCLFLVILLFYTGINMAERGSKDLLGVDEPLQAFRIYTREGGELEIFWSGSSRVFNFSFVTERAAHLWEGLRSFMESRRGRNSGEG